MKTRILAPALALAVFSLAACGPKADSGNNAAATDTLTLNEEGGFGNGDDFATGNDLAVDNGIAASTDNTLPPAEGNSL